MSSPSCNPQAPPRPLSSSNRTGRSNSPAAHRSRS
jgi:hypothetical protein